METNIRIDLVMAWDIGHEMKVTSIVFLNGTSGDLDRNGRWPNAFEVSISSVMAAHRTSP